ncbi:hypothetical protein [Pedobacter sp. JCM 36344]|uniref:hypothetical protein n=1 Tax=Pedobacter sp. JCM 36344 TaxID=3374280 RepID=UPI00397DE118
MEKPVSQYSQMFGELGNAVNDIDTNGYFNSPYIYKILDRLWHENDKLSSLPLMDSFYMQQLKLTQKQ